MNGITGDPVGDHWRSGIGSDWRLTIRRPMEDAGRSQSAPVSTRQSLDRQSSKPFPAGRSWPSLPAGPDLFSVRLPPPVVDGASIDQFTEVDDHQRRNS